jgi:TM2 domain-containing membrane protein YozV
MNASSLRARAPAALLGLLVGGAAGFLLTETLDAIITFALDRTLDVDGTSGLLAAFIAVPILCALIGAVISAHRTGRHMHNTKDW